MLNGKMDHASRTQSSNTQDLLGKTTYLSQDQDDGGGSPSNSRFLKIGSST